MDFTDVRWLFFDVGNTLSDEGPAHADRNRRIAQALAEHGTAVPIEAVERAFEQAAAAFVPRLIVGALAALVDDLTTREAVLRAVRYRKELEVPQPEAWPVLANLAQHYRIAVVANQPAGTQTWLAQAGLAPFVSFCVNSTEAGVAKPDPAIFCLALERAGCTPGQTIMIGDRLDNDIRPARGLGLRTIRVLTGYHRVQSPRDCAEEPDATVGRLGDLLALLSRLPSHERRAAHLGEPL